MRRELYAALRAQFEKRKKEKKARQVLNDHCTAAFAIVLRAFMDRITICI